VSCDPATLARDIGVFARLGWRLDGLRAFDIFPMTHHVECVAALTPEHAPAPRRARPGQARGASASASGSSMAGSAGTGRFMMARSAPASR
jgi:hypothetical protein